MRATKCISDNLSDLMVCVCLNIDMSHYAALSKTASLHQYALVNCENLGFKGKYSPVNWWFV